jgi:SAM-dependent methyltransferase
MPWPIPPGASVAELRRQFAVEKELADRLKAADREERAELYGTVYDELFRRLPDLPQVKQRTDPAAKAQLVELQAHLLDGLLGRESTFVEVGSGDCALALHLASQVRRVVAVEASSELVAGLELPPNFELAPARGSVCDLPDQQADVAYSCHFLEHLHPDDAFEHLREMRRILRPGGRYLVVTPNRIYGPHDVSRYFGEETQGLHLREYGHGDLAALLRRAGFARVERLRGIGRKPDSLPVWPSALAENAAMVLPAAWRRALLARGAAPPFRPLEQVMLVATR